MLKILQARLQQYMNRELPDGDFKKAKEPEIKSPTSLDYQNSKGVSEKHLFPLY